MDPSGQGGNESNEDFSAYICSTCTGKPHALAGIPGQRRSNCVCRQQVMHRIEEFSTLYASGSATAAPQPTVNRCRARLHFGTRISASRLWTDAGNSTGNHDALVCEQRRL